MQTSKLKALLEMINEKIEKTNLKQKIIDPLFEKAKELGNDYTDKDLRPLIYQSTRIHSTKNDDLIIPIREEISSNVKDSMFDDGIVITIPEEFNWIEIELRGIKIAENQLDEANEAIKEVNKKY